MEHCILQNNACNIYEEYFADVEAISLIQRAFSRTVNVYRDPLTMKRQITHLSWSPDQGNRFAASYCNVDFKKTFSSNYTSYIWEVGALSKRYSQDRSWLIVDWYIYEKLLHRESK